MAKVQINYKSGQSMVIECDSFRVRRVGGDLHEIEWKDAKPRPLLFGISDIESIWDLS